MRYRPAFDFAHRPALRHTGAMFLSLTLLASCRSAAPGVAQTGGVSGDMARGSSNRAAAPRATQSTAREQTADQQVQHVLNRLAFGPRPGDSEAVRRRVMFSPIVAIRRCSISPTVPSPSGEGA